MLAECTELLDETVIGELLECAVERGRPEMKLAASLVKNVAHDPETVFGLGGEGEKDVKGRRLHLAIVTLYIIGRSRKSAECSGREHFADQARRPALRSQPGAPLFLFPLPLPSSLFPLPCSLFPLLPPSQAPERITHIRITALEPTPEPLCALGGRAVRELVGADGAGHLRLESVVTNC